MPDDGGLAAALLFAGAGGLLPEADVIEAVRVTGPRRWWSGPLDVEGLTLGSVRLAGAALGELLGRRGALSLRSERAAAAFDSSGRLRLDGNPLPQFAELSRFWPTADGWIRTHGNYPHHAVALLNALGLAGASAGEAPPVEAVADALAGLTSVEAERLIGEHGGIAAAVRSRTAWEASAAGLAAHAHRGAALRVAPNGPPARAAADGAPRTGPTPPGAEAGHAASGGGWKPARDGAPLTGLRVLDLTRVLAGPSATRTLAAFGADVLRIDPPHLPEIHEQHLDTDGGKRVVPLGLRARAARVHELLASAHVVVTGYRPGAFESLGLGRAALAERHPHLVRASLDAWGPGPWENRRGFDSIVQAACGISNAYRAGDGRPGALPVQALDHATGQLLVAGIASLLAHGVQTGAPGGSVEAALAHTAEALWALPVPRPEAAAPLDPVEQDVITPALGDLDAERVGRLHVTPQPLDLDGAPPRPAVWLRADDRPEWLV